MARRPINRLTDRMVRSIKQPGRHADGNGLYLQVDDSLAKRWVFVFQWEGKRKEMGLGPIDLVGLGEAREARDRARKLVFKGVNPIEERKRTKGVAPTFGELADEVVAALTSKNPKHKDQWKMTLTEYAGSLRPLPVDAITTDHILEALKPIWNTKHETASRTRGRIERVLDAAKARGFREGENPARWKGHLALLLTRPRQAVKHHAALPYRDLPAFMVQLRERVGISARALEFTILTAARTGETIGSTAQEFDRERRLWIVPADRMKGGREHRVPLTDAAMAVLEAMNVWDLKPGAFLFPGAKAGKPISNMSMDKVLRTMELDVTVHGFRSAFKDWAEDTTNFPSGIIEAALAHLVGDETERAYRRGDALEKRRALMEAWAGYCAKPTAQVVSLSRPV
ncbi:tyrosine-type recombinase/integrase [Phenylobacterium deserti]|uniref:Integrase n=1 Tax=Phenylobacterium deserti TaxID=1914756 RepID=A0A328ABS2_9CAUL|nr:site-specific integrase [Phenylobacterium deserti]RAK52090.1 integrase [Phenylobacterium deserti]